MSTGEAAGRCTTTNPYCGSMLKITKPNQTKRGRMTMAKQITKTVYSFKELIERNKQGKTSSAVVERVRSGLSTQQTVDQWYEYVQNIWTSALTQIGFTEIVIAFSGFGSQGDGASFTAKSIDFVKLIAFLTTNIEPKACIEPTPRTGDEEDFWPYVASKIGNHYWPRFEKLREHASDLSGEVVRRSSHYSHSMTCFVEVETTPSWLMAMDHLVNQLQDATESLRYALSNAIYADLEAEYETLTSVEALIEYDESSDNQWDDKGRLE